MFSVGSEPNGETFSLRIRRLFGERQKSVLTQVVDGSVGWWAIQELLISFFSPSARTAGDGCDVEKGFR